MYCDFFDLDDEFGRSVMQEQLYQWMKNLVFFYVIFQAILQLLPEKKYEKYVRFYMGLLLILLMISPVFLLVGKSEELWEDFGEFYKKEEWNRLWQEAENLQEYYLKMESEKWYEFGLEEAADENE